MNTLAEPAIDQSLLHIQYVKKDGHKKGCLLAFLYDDQLHFGYSYLCSKDQFHRDIGLAIAQGRAIENFEEISLDQVFKTKEENKAISKEMQYAFFKFVNKISNLKKYKETGAELPKWYDNAIKEFESMDNIYDSIYKKNFHKVMKRSLISKIRKRVISNEKIKAINELLDSNT